MIRLPEIADSVTLEGKATPEPARMVLSCEVYCRTAEEVLVGEEDTVVWLDQVTVEADTVEGTDCRISHLDTAAAAAAEKRPATVVDGVLVDIGCY